MVIKANCGLRPQPLWANPDYLSENIKDGVVYNYGIAFQIPELSKVRRGIISALFNLVIQKL